MQFGPIKRQPARRTLSRSIASRARPSASHSLKPALMTQIARTCLLMQSSTAASTSSAGTTIIARSTRPGISVTRRYAVSPAIVVGGRVDRHDRSGESRGDQVVEDLGSDLAALCDSRRPRPRPRLEERAHRRRRRQLGARGGLFDEVVGDGERQRDAQHARARVGRSRSGRSCRNTSSMRRLSLSTSASNVVTPAWRARLGELLEQASADAVPLHRIRDGERHLRSFGRVGFG